jgi:hypothetical protein
MQTWSEGRPVALAEFAEYMIKISDNTATDHLMAILGREQVEKALVTARHSQPEVARPMLATAEMFKLKWAAPVEWAKRFFSLSELDKKKMLDTDVSQIPLSQVGRNGVSMDLPTWIRQIEWFASNADLCRVMESLAARRDPTTLKILSQNTPYVTVGEPTSAWSYVGYKGGSEPGVISMTYLLRDKKGRLGCLSTSWSNERRDGVDDLIMGDLVRKALKVYENSL